jgi:uncharacterized protein (DUF1778 family)
VWQGRSTCPQSFLRITLKHPFVMTMSGGPGYGGWARGDLMASSQLRSEKLDLRLTPAAKQTLQRAAAAAQRSVSDFVLESALDSAAETLADRRVFELEPERWEAFVAALDSPPQVHARLARLLREPSVFEATSGSAAE